MPPIIIIINENLCSFQNACACHDYLHYIEILCLTSSSSLRSRWARESVTCVSVSALSFCCFSLIIKPLLCLNCPECPHSSILWFSGATALSSQTLSFRNTENTAKAKKSDKGDAQITDLLRSHGSTLRKLSKKPDMYSRVYIVTIRFTDTGSLQGPTRPIKTF